MAENASDELERLRILRSNAVAARDAAEEVVRLIDDQIAAALRSPRYAQQRADKKRSVQAGTGESPDRPRNASPEQKLCYWGIFAAGGRFGRGGKLVTYEQFHPYVEGVATHTRKQLPDRATVIKRLNEKTKPPAHLVGNEVSGWRLTELGDQVRQLIPHPKLKAKT